MAEMIEGGFGGRLALREEGKWWVCYWAKLDTMTGAVPVARVRMNLVVEQPLLRQQFINFCKACFDVAAREALGTDPEWPKPPMPAKD
jgi:hypothetical protein